MLKFIKFLVLLLFVSCKNEVADNVIYGKDDRREPFEVVNKDVQQNILGVGALMDKSNIKDGKLIASNWIFGDEYQLCPQEPYFYQPIHAYCSAFAINDSVIVSAGHCLEDKDVVFVLGYQMADVQSLREDILVFEIKTIKKKIISNNLDLSVIVVKSKIPKDRQLKINTGYRPRKNKKIYVIGHPCGLPMKIASGAVIRQKFLHYFTTNLDTYGGNSGSPVFNHDTHLVEGILVRGEQDFVKRGSCYISNKCENKTCSGEDVVYINEILPFL